MRLSSPLISAFVVTSLLLISACDSSAQAPGGRRGGGRMGRGMQGAFLLTQKSVQEELKMTPQQVTDVTKMVEEQSAARQELRSADESKREQMAKDLSAKSDAAVAKILSADQVKRFEQI